MHKSEFGEAHYAKWLKSTHTKFILKILGIPTSFYKFWKFETISKIIYLKQKKKKKGFNSTWAESGPWLQLPRCGGLRPGHVVACPVPSPRPRRCRLPRSGLRPKQPGGPRGGVASDGSPVDGARQGWRRKNPRSAAKAPGKRKRGGAHPSGDST
jgi:hypothetical protein